MFQVLKLGRILIASTIPHRKRLLNFFFYFSARDRFKNTTDSNRDLKSSGRIEMVSF